MGAPDLRVIDGNGEVYEDIVAVPDLEAQFLERLKKLMAENAGLKGELTKLRKVDPRSREIQEVLEYWKRHCKHDNKRVQIPVDGARWKVAKARLADGYELAQLKAVCDAAVRYPFEQYGRRFSEMAPGRVRRDDLVLLFRDEARVEKMLALGDGDGPSRVYKRLVWQACKADPGVVSALAVLASSDPQGEVLAAAARWAKGQPR